MLFKTKAPPYTKERMENLFAKYTDVDDPSIIGGEGLEKLCTDAGISMEGIQPLILSWLLDASELGKLKKEEWLKGFHGLQSVVSQCHSCHKAYTNAFSLRHKN